MTLPRHIGVLLWIVAFVFGPWGCSRTPSSFTTFNERFEIGPGQQAVMAAMAGQGETLPGNCRHTGTVVQRTFFQAHYTCTSLSESPTIEFRHREVAPPGSVVTAQFSLIPFGARGVPTALLTAVTARVRARESAWHWVGHTNGRPPTNPRGPPPPVQPPPAAPATDVPPATDAPPPTDAAPRSDASAPRQAASSSGDAGPPVVVAAPPVVVAPTRPAPPPAPVVVPPPPAPPVVVAPPTPPAPPPAPVVVAPPPPVPLGPPVATPAMPPTGPLDTAVDTPFGERGPALFSIRNLLTDGPLLFLVGLAFILVVVRRQLRDDPPWVRVALAATVVVGTVLRAAMSPVAPLNAWSYARIIPLAQHTYEGLSLPLFSEVTRTTFHLTGVNFTAGFLLASATPLVLFAHARYVLKDPRSALAAAVILALLPMHLRFSHSDVEIVQTLLTSSLTFVVLYGALTDPSPRWRIACFVALPLLCLATYYSRPEAIIFFPLDLGGIAIAWSASPRLRRGLAAGLVTAAAVFSIFTHLLVRYRQNLDDGLSVRTLVTALRTLFSPRFNMLLSPRSTPPGLLIAAVLGAVYLWRRGERARSVFLSTWLLAFFVVHSYVIPWVPAMQARYHLNLITPFVLLAAALAPALADAPRWARLAAGAYLLASPLLHSSFIRDVDYFEMREFAFLESVRDRIPDRCTVLEFQPTLSFASPAQTHASRLNRVGARVRSGSARWSWDVVSLGMTPPARPGVEPHEVLSDEARAVIAHPPDCLMVYLGLTCRSHRPLSEPVAPVCTEIRAALPLERVAGERFRSHVYDSVSVGRLVPGPEGRTLTIRALGDGDEVELGLYRLRR